MWLLGRFGICPNGYYNYKKKRKAEAEKQKSRVLRKIERLYHGRMGAVGYRMMRELLKAEGTCLSKETVRRYMNVELGLKSVTRKRKPGGSTPGKEHKTFENLLKGDFSAAQRNQIWCTDFTYLRLADGSFRYNCTIVDLYDRRVVAERCGKKLDTMLAAQTLKLGLKKNPAAKGLILHSDQGSPYTSKAFTKYCKRKKLVQSMSRAGTPGDNAVMERYFNTLKAELVNQVVYREETELYRAIAEFSYDWYNEKRPHTYNGGRPPAQVL